MSRYWESRLRSLPVVLLGPGRVGRAFLRHLGQDADRLAQEKQLRLAVVAVADRSACVRGEDGAPIGETVVSGLCDAKRDGRALRGLFGAGPPESWLGSARWPGFASAPVLVDCRSGGDSQALLAAREQGWRLVLANKLPLTASLDDFERLTAAGAAWEATVAAALPVVDGLRSRLEAGDTPRRIGACLSGTLGFLVEGIGRGEAFSERLAEAQALGYAESDPRDDLLGLDCARKALILARMMGWPLALEDVEREGLIPEPWAALERDALPGRLPELDAGFALKAAGARQAGRTLRYTARLEAGRLRCGLEALDPASPLARVAAADSVVAFETPVFSRYPLVISGRGAGPAATAACVYADLLRLASQAA